MGAGGQRVSQEVKSGGEEPHYLGHRQRLRERLVGRGGEALADYEILEALLFAAKPRGDVKPLAKALIRHFGSFAKVMAAEPRQLSQVQGMGTASIAAIKVVREAALRLAREEAMERPVISSWDRLLAYVRIAAAHETVE